MYSCPLSLQISMNVLRVWITATMMPTVRTPLVASAVPVKLVSLEMGRIVKVHVQHHHTLYKYA